MADKPNLKNREARMRILAKFRDDILRKAFNRAGGRCECEARACGHEGRCRKTFSWDDRATTDNDDGWQGHHMTAESAGGSDGVSNCKILCVACHKRTESFGRQA